jgi:hypothetical protein
MADSATDTVMLSERIGVADLDSEHFRAQLLDAFRGRSATLARPSKPIARSEPPSRRVLRTGCGPI